jgi:hypothetical protein
MWLLFTGLACKPAAVESSNTRPPSCPACECKCACDEPGAGTPVVAGAAGGEDFSDLVHAASRKMNKRDGKGCLADLDRAIAIAPKKADMVLHQRAICTMLAGRCDAGKKIARQALEETMLEQWGPEQIDKSVDAYVGMYCTGEMSDRDRMLQALAELQKGAYMTRKTAQFCEAQHRSIEGLRGKVKPKNDDDTQIANIEQTLHAMVPTCYARAGDCSKAWATYRVLAVRMSPATYAKLDAKHKDSILRSSFDSIVPSCKGK